MTLCFYGCHLYQGVGFLLTIQLTLYMFMTPNVAMVLYHSHIETCKHKLYFIYNILTTETTLTLITK